MHDAVTELADHRGWRVITALLAQEIGSVDSTLDSPDKPLEHTEYALLHGRRGGLKGATEAMEAVIEKTEAIIEAQRQRHEAGAESLAGSVNGNV